MSAFAIRHLGPALRGSAVLAAVGIHFFGSSFGGGLRDRTAAAAVPTAGPSPREDRGAPPANDQLSRILRSLEGELELAEGRRPYVVVDVEPPRLRLLSHGVLLREIPAAAVEVAAARPLFGSRPEPTEIFDRVWRAGRLTPPRERVRSVQISSDSTAAGEESEPPIPPLPEEIYPTPQRFLLRLEGGLTAEFRPTAEEGRSPRPQASARLSDLWASSRGTDRWRLRITVSPEAHAELYRSLPDSCALIVRAAP